jgi:hypothetical protein
VENGKASAHIVAMKIVHLPIKLETRIEKP